MLKKSLAAAFVLAAVLLLGDGLSVGAEGRPQQAVPADWLTDGGNPQRTAWQPNERRLSVESVGNMRLLWKYRTDNASREMHNLFPPLIVGRVSTPGGPKRIAVVAGVSDNLYGIDVATGQLVWKRHFDTTFTPPEGTRYGALCPGGITATPVITPPTPAGQYLAYAISWDGRLRTVDVATGAETVAPRAFLPPNGKPYALNFWHGVLYTTTGQRCGGTPNLVYAYDLATETVSTYSPGSGGMWGRTGPSISKDGLVMTSTGDGTFRPDLRVYGNAVIAVKHNPTTKALSLVDFYGPPNAEYLLKRDLNLNVTGPVFELGGREFTVHSSKECRLWLLDTSELGGEDHRTAEFWSPLLCNEEQNFSSAGVWGAMATYADTAGTRWVYVPFWGPKYSGFSAPIEYGEVYNGAIAAFKVEERDGRYRLTPAWLSRDMRHSDPPVIANGVVFGYGSGEDVTQSTPPVGPGGGATAARIANSSHAVLYAFDAATGRELWSSGSQITSFNHFSGLSVANGRVYITTYEGDVYCFGLPQ